MRVLDSFAVVQAVSNVTDCQVQAPDERSGGAPWRLRGPARPRGHRPSGGSRRFAHPEFERLQRLHLRHGPTAQIRETVTRALTPPPAPALTPAPALAPAPAPLPHSGIKPVAWALSVVSWRPSVRQWMLFENFNFVW